MNVRTRFAPSPTGSMHIGNLRTALYSYALARNNRGKFILRIEDTDKKREVEGGVQYIVNNLKIFDLDYDEGPFVGGPYAPYMQSERLDIYRKKADELIKKGRAYYCFCSQERLDKLREEQKKQKKRPMYDGKCRNLDIQESHKRVKNGEKYVIRLKVPESEIIKINDVLLGEVKWESDDIDDQVLLKSDGFPTYHLAVVVDDIIMKISHISRGIEWLASVPKHVLLYKAFEYPLPIMAHMPVILDPSGGKLSKRKGNVSVGEFLNEGYLPEALLNFLMLLGWAPEDNREFFTLGEFVDFFSLEGLNKSSPVFDRTKLLWFNGQYIRKLTIKDFTKKVLDWVKNYCRDEKMKEKLLKDKIIEGKLKLVQERVSLLSDVVESLRFFYEYMKAPDLKTIKGIKKYDSNDYKMIINDYLEIVSKYKETDQWSHEKWESDIRLLGDKYNWKHGDLFMLIRLAIVGSQFSPPLFESMVIIGKNDVIKRLNAFL